MNNNLKIYTLLFIVFFSNFGLRAQTVSTYFSFKPNSNLQNLITDTNGNLYFTMDDSNNQQRSIKKVDSNGMTTAIISVSTNDQIYFQNLITDTMGNLYFIMDDNNNQQRAIKKVDSNGMTTDIISVSTNDPIYFQNLVTDTMGNLYFIMDDNNNQQRAIKKVDSNGMTTAIISVSTNDPIYFQNLVRDTMGNLYFIMDDNNNQQRAIKKVDSNGMTSDIISVTNDPIYYQNLVTDTMGNLYFIMDDNNNQQRAIKKVDSNGMTTNIISVSINDPIYFQNIITDNEGNLFFIEYNNGRQKIMTVTNPNYSCSPPSAPTATNTAICAGNTAFLTATGIGELRWYDAPTGGNLVATENEFTTPILNSETTYYVEGFFCNSSSSRTPVTVSVLDTPVAVISGETTGNDFVTLTASGNGTYLWSAGYAPNQAVNYFTESGTYSVTVTNAGGCSSTANVTVIVNKLGINKFGQLISDATLKVNKNGTINALNYVNKHGKSASSVPSDGKLNYKIFNAPASYPNNANEFTAYTNSTNQTTSGTYNASVLLNWENASILTSAGIPIPNGGDRFAVEVNGFFIPEESGTYTFTCEGDDAVDLFINGTNVANCYGVHGISVLGSHTGTIALVAGIKYTFRARMQENAGGEALRVYWRKPSENSGWTIYTDELSSF